MMNSQLFHGPQSAQTLGDWSHVGRGRSNGSDMFPEFADCRAVSVRIGGPWTKFVKAFPKFENFGIGVRRVCGVQLLHQFSDLAVVRRNFGGGYAYDGVPKRISGP